MFLSPRRSGMPKKGRWKWAWGSSWFNLLQRFTVARHYSPLWRGPHSYFFIPLSQKGLLRWSSLFNHEHRFVAISRILWASKKNWSLQQRFENILSELKNFAAFSFQKKETNPASMLGIKCYEFRIVKMEVRKLQKLTDNSGKAENMLTYSTILKFFQSNTTCAWKQRLTGN